jgi:RHS repeat-associated protein
VHNVFARGGSVSAFLGRRRGGARRRGRLAAAAALSLVASLAVAIPLPSAAAAAASPVCPVSRPDQTSALITARMCNGRVSIDSLENETDVAYALPNGSIEWDHNFRPVRVPGADGWIPVDTTLAVQKDGTVAPAAAAVQESFSGGGSGPLVTVSNGPGESISLGSPLGPLPVPVLSGSVATYPDVLPGVDLQLRADVDGFAQVLVVKTAAAAANPALASLQFGLSGKGLTTKTDAAGNIDIVDGSGAAVFHGAAPSMWDAQAQVQSAPNSAVAGGTDAPPSGVLAQSMNAGIGIPGAGGHLAVLAASVSASKLTVTPSATMLTNPSASFPIYIDPGFTATESGWTEFNKNTPTTSYWNATGDAEVGTWDGGTDVWRSMFNLNVKSAPFDGKNIVSAKLNLHEVWAYSCTAAEVDLYSNSPMATSSMTWSSQPTWGTLQSKATVAYNWSSAGEGGSSTCGGGNFSMDATPITQLAANGSWGNITLGLRAASETSNTGWKRFDHNPTLTVTYNSPPTITRMSTGAGAPCTTGTNYYIGSPTPTLSAWVSQAESAASTVNIEWWNAAGTTRIGTSSIPNVASGGEAGAYPSGEQLTDGTSYEWRADANVAGNSVGAWSAWCQFTVDTTAPTAIPTVSSTAYPQNAWTDTANTAGAFTFGASGVADVASYYYTLTESGTNTTTTGYINPATIGGPATVNLTPTSDGIWTLAVSSIDRAGNIGPAGNYQFEVGAGAVIAPAVGSVTASLTQLQAAVPSGTTGVTFQWRRADTDTWQTIPLGDVTVAAGGGAVTSWPVPTAIDPGTSQLESQQLNWNVKSTLGGSTALAGPVFVQALMPGGAVSAENSFTYDPNLATAATSTVGPGSVNLVTGNLQVSASDVSVGAYSSDLTTSRTFNTRQAGAFDATHMFGPGWSTSAMVTSADSPYSSLTVAGSLVQVGMPDGSTIGFTAAKSPAGSFVPQIGADDLTLTYTSASNTYTLQDQDGNIVGFANVNTATPTVFVPTSVTQPSNGQSTTMTWQTATVDGVTVTRPTTLVAPTPGVTCPPVTTKGCRSLAYTYATVTTATGTTQAGWGDYAGRVQKISFTAWDPVTSTQKTVDVAKYDYDSNGRLVAEWDPRLDNGATHLWTTYSYNSDGTLATIADNTQPAWNLAYTTVPGDSGSGRLASATRTDPVTGANTTSVVYNVPLTTATGGPYDMSTATTSTWGESTGPTQATAVYDTGTTSTWTRATVTYMDSNSRTVNTVTPGGNTTTSWYDAYGNVVRSLTADDRAEALANAAAMGQTTQTLAQWYSTTNTYNYDDPTIGAPGVQLLATQSPYHQIQLATGAVTWGTNTTTDTYNDSGCACGLVTSETKAVTYWSGGAMGSGTLVTGAEPHTTTTTYNWTTRNPLISTVDPDGLALATTTTYDPATAQPATVTTPAGGSTNTTPATTATTYYTAAANSTYPECGSHAEWAGLTCRTAPGGQPLSGPELPATETTYNMYNEPLVITEKTSAGVLRTTTKTYDATTDRLLTTAIVGASGTGTTIPTVQNVYDPATGNLIHVQSLVAGTVTAQTTTGYDTFGRVTSYADTDGVQSTTSYDLLGRASVTSDGQQSTTTSYDTGGENRGLATQIVDGQAGTITGTYDPDGNLVTENWPNGIVATHTYNETGTQTGITYTQTGCGQPSCVLYTETDLIGSTGDVAAVDTGNTTAYAYDNAGRLTTFQDDGAGTGCVTRTYGFGSTYSGKASDRTSLTTYTPNADGSCQTATGGTTKTWTYDSADRPTTVGYTYDSLGRTTTVPAADTQLPTAGNLTATYNVNDLVHTLTSGGATSTYNLDVDNQRIRSWTDTVGTTHTNHYNDTTDSPSWTNEGNGTWTRPINGLAGMAVLATGGGSTNLAWQLCDIHGDVIATVNNTDIGLDTVSTSDEFGNMTNTAETGADRYAWLGTKQRAADNPDGIILMGVRLYNPALGRFLSVDPISGGSANRYDYGSANPITHYDLDGQCWSWLRSACHVVTKVWNSGMKAQGKYCSSWWFPFSATSMAGGAAKYGTNAAKAVGEDMTVILGAMDASCFVRGAWAGKGHSHFQVPSPGPGRCWLFCRGIGRIW